VTARVRTVAVCHPQVPFSEGGAELLARSLVEALRARGYEATLVSVPFRWTPRREIGRSCLAWRLLDLSESNGRRIDLVIATKFPSYVVRHERKVTWLVHQFRQVYELHGTPWSDFGGSEEDRATRELVRRVDARTLAESEALFAISRNVAARLRRHNGLEATPLHPPPRGRERFSGGGYGRYVLSVGRLEPMKRVDALVEALPHADPALRCVIVGSGPEEERLRARAAALGVSDRVELRGAVDFETLLALYRDCLAVYFAPYDEDYGLVAVEAFLASKPVVTAPDAGGPLEFVEDQVTGLVTPLEPEALGERLSALHADRKWARDLGHAGAERVRHLDCVVERLVPA
jgi:glycosyltransferase involved in cell wall biosynthesis